MHYEEIGALAREFTGCDAVVYYEALLRMQEQTAAFIDVISDMSHSGKLKAGSDS